MFWIFFPMLVFSIANLSKHHWSPNFLAAHRVLRYIKGTSDLGLFFPSATSSVLKAFSDSDWAGCPDTR
ncbi:hypothetical protein E1A91_D11G188600v1 [Gossypium mustelinum]|uniref:Reverse transcriptase Ty1/copia-type domain-containing protein n=1 Tax=Gossypium mustelinum TaxID=34275 RepID=A0A5D2STB5_GOSMU|nr:hypothetical protein E1A91_D11G188600v1 [Gossypium mustelinum]